MSKESLIMGHIERIEEELAGLKRLLSKGGGESVNLLGIWDGANITDEDIEEAKRSLFKGIELDDVR